MEYSVTTVRNIEEAISFIYKELNIPSKRRYPRSMEYIKEVYSKNPDFFIGAYWGDLLIGALFSYPGFDKREVLLGEIAVLKKFRRRGVGSSMVRRLESICKQNNIRRIYGATTTAKEFYAKLGFSIKLHVSSKKKLDASLSKYVENEWQSDGFYYYIISGENLDSIANLIQEYASDAYIQYLFEKRLK